MPTWQTPAHGNRAQKTRAEVKHSTKKPWRQKGTGRARSGMTSSPLWRKGGRAFPNKPDENFTQKVNRKMYRAGMATILSQLTRDERLFAIEALTAETPKTKVFAEQVKNAECGASVVCNQTARRECLLGFTQLAKRVGFGSSTS